MKMLTPEQAARQWEAHSHLTLIKNRAASIEHLVRSAMFQPGTGWHEPKQWAQGILDYCRTFKHSMGTITHSIEALELLLKSDADRGEGKGG